MASLPTASPDEARELVGDEAGWRIAALHRREGMRESVRILLEALQDIATAQCARPAHPVDREPGD